MEGHGRSWKVGGHTWKAEKAKGPFIGKVPCSSMKRVAPTQFAQKASAFVGSRHSSLTWPRHHTQAHGEVQGGTAWVRIVAAQGW